ncbi:hypothetical protein [Candidatus Palauibacter sp.]|uniref:hypothetical protein n=1 Tax=Candidatus Palauibacter sp. TaxID=3101350 RepID=UPI003AF2A21D
MLTVYGWAPLTKGLFYLLFPTLGLKGIARGLSLGAGQWRAAGGLVAVLGIVVLWYALA